MSISVFVYPCGVPAVLVVFDFVFGIFVIFVDSETRL
jgi:hypothetical protein